MRISDWSSDVCSSDLLAGGDIAQHAAVRRRLVILGAVGIGDAERDAGQAALAATLQEFCFGLEACADVRRCALVQTGRASGRESVCLYVSISVVAVSLNKNILIPSYSFLYSID